MTSYTKTTRVTVALALTLIAGGSFALSLVETRVNRDVFHWGLMYSSSYDLLLGRTPYRDTYEVYGILSSVIFALAMLFTSKSLVVLGVVAGLAYSASLLLTYGLWRRCTSALPAVCAVLAAFAVHPRITYPWSNYIAYAFMLAALLVLLRGRHNHIAGILFGMAMLSRHSFVLIVAPALVASLALRLLPFHTLIAVALGATATVLPLVVYVAVVDVWGDFFRLTVTVNRALLAAIAEWQSTPSTLEFVQRLLSNITVNPVTLADGRTRAFSIVAAVGLLTLLVTLARLVKRGRMPEQPRIADADRNAAVLALFALCGFSQALHSYEVFRLATAVGVGLGLPFYLLSKLPSRRAVWISCLAGLVTIALPVSPELFATSVPDTGNISVGSNAVEPIRFKRWPQAFIDNYTNATATLASLSRCGVTQLVNLGPDPLLSYLVPELGKPQREPSRMPWHRSDIIFADEPERRFALITEGNAVVVTAGNTRWVPDPSLSHAYGDSNINIWAPARCRQ